MKTTKAMLAAFAAIVVAACSTEATDSSVKSNYPSDYPLFTDCQLQNGVQLCRSMQGSGAIALDVQYTGPLAAAAGLQMYVKINYLDGARDGTFPMLYNGVEWSRGRVTNGCLVGQLGGCAEDGTDAMRHLLYWAGRPFMTANALSVEIALVDANGNWDSRFGDNYKFEFGERRL